MTEVPATINPLCNHAAKLELQTKRVEHDHMSRCQKYQLLCRFRSAMKTIVVIVLILLLGVGHYYIFLQYTFHHDSFEGVWVFLLLALTAWILVVYILFCLCLVKQLRIDETPHQGCT